MLIVNLAKGVSQVSEPVREATFGIVGTVMFLQVGARDADVLAKQLGGDVPTARDLVKLANYECFVKLTIKGRQSKPFSAKTLPSNPSHNQVI